jgi:hypothetical protein
MAAIQVLGGGSSSSSSSTPGYLYLPSGWDTGLRTAQAATKSTPWGVAFLGESTANGPSGGYMTSGWPGQIRVALQARYGRYGEAFSPAWNTHDANTATYGFTPPFTPSPDQDVTQSFTVPAGLAFVHKMPNTSTLTLSTAVACPDFDIIYDNTVAGTWTYNVDAAGAQTVTPTGNSTTAALARVQIRGLSNTIHTIVCGTQNISNTMQIAAVAAYPNGAGANGCGVYFSIKNGFDTSGYMSSPYGTGVPARFAGLGGITGFPVQPSLIFVMFGINDHPNHSPARIMHGWGQMIKALRYGKKNASIFLLSYPYPDTNYTGMVTSFGTAGSTYDNYVEAYRWLAERHGCAHLDLSTKWGGSAFADGMFTSNTDPHPSVLAHNDVANTVIPLVI